MYKSLAAVLAAGFVTAPLAAVTAQQPQLTPEAMAMIQSRTVQVNPTFVLLTPATKSFTVELTNPGDSAISADVSVQFAAPRTDANANIVDSVLPGTSERSLTTWLSGVPQSVTLAPKAKQTLTVNVAMPAKLTDGEYWGRIMIARKGIAMQLPAMANGMATKVNANLNLQSPVAVFYRRGTPSTGLEISQPTATVTGNAVRACMVMHRTGTVHYEGVINIALHNEATNQNQPIINGAPLTVYDDLKPCIAFNGVPPGKYSFVVTTQGDRPNVAAPLRVVGAPAKVTIPFEIPAAKQ